MKIAYVFPRMGGGVQQYVNTLTSSLVEQFDHIEIHHIFAEYWDAAGPETFGHTSVFYHEMKLPASASLLYDASEDCIQTQVEAEFVTLLDEIDPDIVHFQHVAGLGASLIGLAKQKGMATFWTLHDYWSICPRFFLLKHDLSYCEGPNQGASCFPCLHGTEQACAGAEQQKYLERYRFIKSIMIEKTDQIITVSDSVRDKLIAEGIPEAKIRTVYPGVRSFTPVPKPRKKDPTTITFGYLGQLSTHKGAHVLIDAFQQLPHPESHRLLLYGGIDRMYKETLMKLIAGRTNIDLKGAYQSNQLSDILAEMDVLVVPSVCPETATLVTQEALMSGTPVIGSNIGGIPEFIKEEYGALFEAGNSEALAKILTLITENPAILQSWSNHIPALTYLQDMTSSMYAMYEEKSRQRRRKRPLHRGHFNILHPADRAYMRGMFFTRQVSEAAGFFRRHDYERIGIFGSGLAGRQAAEFWRQQGLTIPLLLDNNQAKWGTLCQEIPVVNPELLYEQQDALDVVIIISEWESSIMEQLKSMNLRIPILGFYSFAGEGGGVL
ncbi:glycosyltransferase [Paenibacillus hexagrammi]|uniref:Glycosyltransferase n=1 Tax=Paenibacillus hexagrammi TaxID=2908839 RepID=A0ABY3SGZ2_9BACL|nr:glycosyltransferase [Paenibacillus sp. YPD9-1]UJF33206.1 glycosyltransferase [Paenibacillus sp. YPD9-1]